ncbi:hypothetical protein AC249_AIPGENE14472 [Exaiptasia diaphana]|nr:hypothetical protein AC249_AIPGENE14472 [Exaiptasia diaphana]
MFHGCLTINGAYIPESSSNNFEKNETIHTEATYGNYCCHLVDNSDKPNTFRVYGSIWQGLTIRRLNKLQGIQNHLSEGQRNIRARRTQSAVRIVLASVLLYACSWFPNLVLYVVRLTNAIFPSADIMNSLLCIDWRSLYFIITQFLPLVNSCFSPCIYVIFLSDFRDAAKKILCQKRAINQALNNPIELQPMSPVCNRRRGRRRSDEDRDI